MNLLESLLSANSGTPLNQLSQNFGISQPQAKSAVGSMLPALTRALQKNMSTAAGLTSVLGALSSGNHQRYLDTPEELTNEATTTDGNAILGHLFGSKDVSRNVAAHAAKETGLDVDMLKKMLPVLATMAMGALSKEASNKSLLGASLEQSTTSSNLSGLASFLDSDKDGSIADDLLSLASRFF